MVLLTHTTRILQESPRRGEALASPTPTAAPPEVRVHRPLLSLAMCFIHEVKLFWRWNPFVEFWPKMSHFLTVYDFGQIDKYIEKYNL